MFYTVYSCRVSTFVPYYTVFLRTQEFLPWCSSSTSEINWSCNWNWTSNVTSCKTIFVAKTSPAYNGPFTHSLRATALCVAAQETVAQCISMVAFTHTLCCAAPVNVFVFTQRGAGKKEPIFCCVHLFLILERNWWFYSRTSRQGLF